MDKAEVVLEVLDLEVKLKTAKGAVPLLEPVQLNLKKVRSSALLASGCGKTVTCNAIMRLLHPRRMEASGSVRLNGRELGNLSEEEMRRIRGKDIGFIMQNPMNAFTLYTRSVLNLLKRCEPIRRCPKQRHGNRRLPRWLI